MKKRTEKTLQLCLLAMMTALAILLEYAANLTTPLLGGNLKISFAGLPIIVAAMLLGPAAGFSVGFVSSLLGQMIAYGFTPTTILWVLPAAVRGLAMGLLFRAFRCKSQVALVSAEAVVTSLLVTAFNTLAIYVDSKLYGYYRPELILGNLAIRLVLTVATAVCIGLLAVPLFRMLKKQGFASRKVEEATRQ